MTDPLTGTPTLMRVTATDGLRLRSAPAGDVLRTLAFEELVTAFLETAVPPPPNEPDGVTWVFVRDKDGTVGWTAKAYLAQFAPPPTPEPPEPPAKLVYTEADINAVYGHIEAINDILEKGVPLSELPPGSTF